MDLTDGLPVRAVPVVNEQLAVVLEDMGLVRDQDFFVSPAVRMRDLKLPADDDGSDR